MGGRRGREESETRAGSDNDGETEAGRWRQRRRGEPAQETERQGQRWGETVRDREAGRDSGGTWEREVKRKGRAGTQRQGEAGTGRDPARGGDGSGEAEVSGTESRGRDCGLR